MTFIRLPLRAQWCDLRAAHPGGRITSSCGDAVDYQLLPITTSVPEDRQCPACRRHCDAVVVVSATAATTTRDLRPSVVVEASELPVVSEVVG